MQVILKVGAGNFEKGFGITLQIRPDGTIRSQVEGRLPPCGTLLESYDLWKIGFERDSNSRNWEVFPSSTVETEPSSLASTYARQLAECVRNWLDSPLESWQRIVRHLDRSLAQASSQSQLIVQTSNPDLWKIPWQVWEIFDRYSQLTLGFAPPEFHNLPRPVRPSGMTRILGVFGDDTHIDLAPDARALGQLDARVLLLPQPSGREFIDRLHQGWDIFFFAGHSTDEGTGKLHLSQNESVEVDRFGHALREAVAGGLQIAFLNSCESWTLIKTLALAEVPIVIAWKEAVPDRVAQTFLKSWLDEYTEGRSLYSAFRTARQRLEEFTDLPGASWLPLLYQHPEFVAPTWKELQQSSSSRFRHWPGALVASSLSTFVVLGLRGLGMLQGIELATYDWMMRGLPLPTSSSPVLVVSVDESDIQYQNQQDWERRGSLSDEALERLVQTLAPHQPKAIGLDILHDFPFSTTLKDSISTIEFISICRIGSKDLTSVPPPPAIPQTRLGFSNFARDRDDLIRRYIVGMTPDRTCPTSYSLALRLASTYLGESLKRDENGTFHLGRTALEPLSEHAGGYQMPSEEALGYQILLDYRTPRTPSVPLREILDGAIESEELGMLVRDRVVLIGVEEEYRDRHHTPIQPLSGVEIHAIAIEQLIESARGNRTLLGWWPGWVEIVWIGVWGVGVGFLTSMLDRPKLVFAIAVSLLTLASGMYFIGGVWIPWLPPILSVGSASLLGNKYKNRNLNSKNIKKY
ncbi:MAG: CHASE2 domain-containing protein [Cyanobacteriota bacterium]|nr:CHASE2 domain-containing protein [Cyanobacteriota bacterium]